jgi:hypothetical protein
MASMFFSYRVYVSSRKLVAEYRNDLFALRQSYAELEKQFTNIANKKKIFQNKPVKTQFSHSPLKDPPITLESGDGSTTDHRKKVQQIAQIISSTGLDQLAVNEDLDPTILTKIYEDYALRDLVSNYREQVLSRNRELLQLDRNQ